MPSIAATDSSGQRVGTLEVVHGERLIGRAAECALVLPGQGVSRVHASVYLSGATVVVRDEGAANGVRVDGRRITEPTALSGASVVGISSYQLRLVPEEREPGPAASRGSGPRGGRAARAAPAAPRALPNPAPADEEDAGPEDSPAGGWELETVLEGSAAAARARAPVAAAASPAPLALVGRGGPYDGMRLALDKRVLTVGRYAGSDLALEHPSISRRHAQLRPGVAGEQLEILDLRSANGTFVGGQRVKRATALVGSVLRFGELSFRLVAAGRDAERGTTRRRSSWRLGASGAAALAVVVAALVAGYAVRARHASPVVETPEDRLRAQAQTTRQVFEEARLRLAAQDWDGALARLDRVLERDPLNAEAKRLREHAAEEREHGRSYEAALRLIARGGREALLAAKTALRRVPAQSPYAREARAQTRAIDERLAADYRDEGLARCRQGADRECYELLCRAWLAVPVDALIVGESGLRRRMNELERRHGAAKDFVRCPAPRYVKAQTQEFNEAEVAAALAGRYADAGLRAALLAYVKGGVDQAFGELARARRAAERAGATTSPFTDAQRRLLLIRARHSAGFAALRQRDAEAADAAWSELLATDRELLPEAVSSLYRREVTQALGGLYRALGEEEWAVGRYAAALELWQRGKRVDPTNAELLSGLLQIEQLAEQALREGQALKATGKPSEARAKLLRAKELCGAAKSLCDQAQALLKER
ncbi:MAG: FHA domain-containing protein [Proteobacteria bacterium]|nr:FHA domain-containing protein [Pseudomonadota bacterium]